MYDDITKQPWATWMEDCLKFLNQEDMTHLAMICVNKDGEVVSGYYHCNSHIKAMIASTVLQDAKLASYVENIEKLNEILRNQQNSDDDIPHDEPDNPIKQ